MQVSSLLLHSFDRSNLSLYLRERNDQHQRLILLLSSLPGTWHPEVNWDSSFLVLETFLKVWRAWQTSWDLKLSSRFLVVLVAWLDSFDLLSKKEVRNNRRFGTRPSLLISVFWPGSVSSRYLLIYCELCHKSRLQILSNWASTAIVLSFLLQPLSFSF